MSQNQKPEQTFQKSQNSNKLPEEPKIQEDNQGISNLIKKAAHPGVCIFTIAFKIGAIVSFILLDLFTSSEALTYLVVILLGSADFWMTKNISGRVLVGLRWWNEVKDDGTEVWIFESKNESKNFEFKYFLVEKENSADKTIFWGSLYINLISWLVLFVWEIIRFKFIWVYY